MFRCEGSPTEARLQQVSLDLGQILLGAIRHSPVVPEYFAQIAAHMVSLALAKSQNYGEAVKAAMVKHGLLSVPGAVTVAAAVGAHPLDAKLGIIDAAGESLPTLDMDVSGYGLNVKKIRMVSASEHKRFAVASAAPATGDVPSVPDSRAALVFFEDLIRRGRLDQGAFAQAKAAVVDPHTLKTHHLVKEGDNVVLRRLRIDCGLRHRPRAPQGSKP